MDHQALAALITERGAKQVAAWVQQMPERMKAALGEGIALDGWRVTADHGLLLFTHVVRAEPSPERAALEAEVATRAASIALARARSYHDPIIRHLSQQAQQEINQLKEGINALPPPAARCDGAVLVANTPPDDLPRYLAAAQAAAYPVVVLSEEAAPF